MADQGRRFAGRPETSPPGVVPGPVVRAAGEARPRLTTGLVWLIQAITGVLLVVFVGIHLIAQHILAPGGLRDFDSVLAYLRQPLPMFAELGLVAVVAVHAALGVRAVLVDIVDDARVVRRATWVLGVLVVVVFVYALWLTLTLVNWR